MAVESLGFLLQGVSQQQPKVRALGEVTEQVNLHSDVIDGLTTRPPTVRKLSVEPTPVGSSSHTVKIDDKLYRIILTDGGVPTVISYEDGECVVTSLDDAEDYIRSDSAVYVYDKTVYITSRSKNVAIEDAPDVESDIIKNWGYIYVLGGAFMRKFRAAITVDGVTFEASYSTPTGTDTAHTAQATPDHIIENLVTDINAKATTAGVTGLTVSRFKNYVIIRHSTNKLEAIASNDGENNTLMKSGVAQADDLSELPKYAPHGAYCIITGSTSTADDVWMRYEIPNETVGNGFGADGTWREWYDIATPTFLDVRTMPHKLVMDEDGDFVLSSEEWLHRRVGSGENIKPPSFVGASIRDIMEYQGRLVFATSAGTVVMSRTDLPMDFFPKSATASVASDPVDLAGRREGSASIEWLVPFDRDLMCLSELSQFVIGGSPAVTPQATSMVVATTFTMALGCRPVGNGRTLLLPHFGVRFAGVNEYYPQDDYRSNSMDSLTKKISKYIDGELRELVVSANDGILLCRTTTSDDGTIWVYKYLWEGEEKTQSAWSKWRFPGEVTHMYIDGGDIYFWIKFRRGEDALGEALVIMQPDLQDIFSLGYRACMDVAEEDVGVVDGDTIYYDAMYPNPVFALKSDDPDAPYGAQIVPDEMEVVGSGTGVRWRCTFNTLVRPWLLSGDICVGAHLKWSVEPSPPLARQRDGTPRSDVNLVVNNYFIDYVNAGPFSAFLHSIYREEFEAGNIDWIPLDDDPSVPWSATLRNGTLEVPWGESTKYATLRVEGEDIRPVSIQEIRFDAQMFKEGG